MIIDIHASMPIGVNKKYKGKDICIDEFLSNIFAVIDTKKKRIPLSSRIYLAKNEQGEYLASASVLVKLDDVYSFDVCLPKKATSLCEALSRLNGSELESFELPHIEHALHDKAPAYLELKYDGSSRKPIQSKLFYSSKKVKMEQQNILKMFDDVNQDKNNAVISIGHKENLISCLKDLDKKVKKELVVAIESEKE